MTLISLATVRCSVETDEVGADEPYVLVTAVNLTSKVNVAGFPVPLPTCDVTRYGPFNDVDAGETHGAAFTPFWTGPTTNPNDAIFVVSMMENDDGNAETLRGIVKSSAVASLFGSLSLPRSEQVGRLINDVGSAKGTPTGAPNFDDKIGGSQELQFSADELGRAGSGQLVSKTMSFAGDGGNYSLRFDASPDIFGAIRDKWIALGAANSPVGVPTGVEGPTFDGKGRAQSFSAGTISWHPSTGAHAVFGDIGARWRQIGREAFGYPVNDESAAGGGRFNDFRALQLAGQPTASIYWSPQTGAHEIFGGIREKWLGIGGPSSSLGYPVGHEQDQPGGGHVQQFQRGKIVWTPQGGAVVL